MSKLQQENTSGMWELWESLVAALHSIGLPNSNSFFLTTVQIPISNLGQKKIYMYKYTHIFFSSNFFELSCTCANGSQCSAEDGGVEDTHNS